MKLFDPATATNADWPAGAATERAYLTAFAAQGSQALIANLRTRVLALRAGDRILPVTVNQAEYGDTYVCLPHSAYALYAREELARADVGLRRPLLAGLARVAGAAMRAARVNRIVHVDNWMLSTNLHGDWRGEDLEAIRRTLADRFPEHVLAVRSVNAWSDGALLARLRSDGWLLLPSRQIYVTDDVARDWAPRTDVRSDLRLFARTTYVFDALARLKPGDAERIAELYAALYLERYSRLNPAFTPAYIEMTHGEGVFDYAGLRDAAGRLVSVVGCWSRGDVLTTPILGYDTARPVREGLYRLAGVMLSQKAQRRGLRLNRSAGAAGFKRARGGVPVIEYWAMSVDHLSRPRRAVLEGLRRTLERFVAPLMAELEL